MYLDTYFLVRYPTIGTYRESQLHIRTNHTNTNHEAL